MSVVASENPAQVREKISLYEQVCGVYKLYRILRMNALYYGARVHRAQRINFWFEILIAISSSATVASVAVFKPFFPYLAGITAILTVIKPILAFPKQIEKFTMLWSGYLEISLEVSQMIEEIQLTHDVTPEMRSNIILIRNKFDELSKRDDPYPNKRLLNKQWVAVKEEVPTNCFWTPPE